jgi:hypothetical protein
MVLGITEAVAGSLFSWVDADGNTQTLDVDVVMSSSDKRSMKMTDHVVEDGSVITDHIVLQPASVSMDLIVTQTPMPGPNDSSSTASVGSAKKQNPVRKVQELKIPPNNFQPGGFLLLSSGARQAVGAVTGALLGAVGLGGPPGNRFEGSDYSEQAERDVKVSAYRPEEKDYVAAVHDKLIEIMEQVLPVTVSFKGRLYIDYHLTEIELSQSFGHGRFKVEIRQLRKVSGTTVSLPDPADFRANAKVTKGNKNATQPKPDVTKPMKSAAKHTAGFVNKVAGIVTE